MQFQVPQFLDVEDKIIGPFTMKQFLYIGGGAGMAYMSWRFVSFLGLGYILALGCLALGGALAFYKFNNKPFAYLIESAFNYSKSSRLYIWRKKEKGAISTELDLSNFQPTKHTGMLPVANASTSKLSDLTWAIDVQSDTIETQKVGSDSAVI